MRFGTSDGGFLGNILAFLSNNEKQLLYTIPFFLFAGIASIRFIVLRPIVAAAFLVLPLHLAVRLAAEFEEHHYEQFSPILQNIHNFRFLLVCLSFCILPILSWHLNDGFGWDGYGIIGFLMVTSSVTVFIWSEGLYVKNFYFNRWHLFERGLLIISGILSILFGPVFIPLFLLGHRLLTHQFDFPDIGGFMGTHSRLPWTILLIASSFAIVGFILPVQPSHLTFLLFGGYSAHYFHPGLAKIINNGPSYYLRKNNPFYLFLNAYAVGWMDFLDEASVLRLGKLSDKIKPALNISVVLIELSSILVIISHPTAIVVVSLTLTLQSLILLTTGVNFWKWIVIQAFMLIGLLLFGVQTFAYFSNLYWSILFVAFVVFAGAWMNPVGMSWLDSTYTEFYEFKGRLSDGSEVNLHPNIFRPYDPMVAQGTQGEFTFLGDHPTITYCLGGINTKENKNMHSKLVSSLSKTKSQFADGESLVEDIGENSQNIAQSEALDDLLSQFMKGANDTSPVLRFFSSPREFYTNGISDRESLRVQSEITCIHVYRIDGLWTRNGFNELARDKVLTIQA